MNPIVKGLLIFAAGLVTGGGVGASVSYYVTKQREEEYCRDEIAALRKHYEDILERYEALEPKDEDEDEVTENEDGIVTVGTGIPTDKKVDTHKREYGQAYKKDGANVLAADIRKKIEMAKARNEAVAPSEDDEEEDILEITLEKNEYTGEPGYGQKSGYYAIEMAYYTKDGGMAVTDWGNMDDVNLERDDMMIANEEDEIIYDIEPYLKAIEFGHKPYDEIYLRDNKRSLDIKLSKRYSESSIFQM